MSHQPEKNRERRSADAYLNFLQRKGADSHALYVRSRFLDTLIPELAGKELSRSTFADAMEKIQQMIYKIHLLKTVSDARLVDEWLHYAKILLIRLRDAPYKDHEIYRTAIDLTITLFKDKSSQKNYLNAARKFYKFWRAKPKGYL